MTLTRRGITVLTVSITVLMAIVFGIGMSFADTICMEDEVLVWDNTSHSKCVHIDNLISWMDEQND